MVSSLYSDQKIVDKVTTKEKSDVVYGATVFHAFYALCQSLPSYSRDQQ